MKNIFFIKIKPARDWQIVVLTFGLGLILLSVFAWTIYLSDQIGGGYLSEENISEGVITRTIDEKRLKNVVQILEQKQAHFENIKTGQIKTIDPTL